MGTLRTEYVKPINIFDRPRWIVLEDFVSECGITVPRDFISDGVSVPFFARPFISSSGMGFRASVVHDYLLKANYTWEDANERFEAQLECDNVPFWLRKMYVLGVALWGIIWRYE